MGAMRTATARRGVEMGDDPSFSPRIKRLAATSVVALGLVWLAAATRLEAHPAIGATLAAGWLSMPAVLWLSLRRPALRYGLVVPSALVTGGLLAVCATALPAASAARAGWLLLTAGVLLGGLLGFWFWFRWLPVPAALGDPFARGRWLLIALHVAPIVVGLLLIGLAPPH